MHFCRLLPDLPEYATKFLFLDHGYLNVMAQHVLTTTQNSHAGVGFGAIFSYCIRYGTLPPYAQIFAAELPPHYFILSHIYCRWEVT